MTRLFGIHYAMGGTTLAGSGVVVALVSGRDTVEGIALGAALGAVSALLGSREADSRRLKAGTEWRRGPPALGDARHPRARVRAQFGSAQPILGLPAR